MQWYHYLSGFWAGVFIGNFVPHFVKGICGDAFPTPFANPPGKGLSSPIVNVWWALLNGVVGYLFFRVGKVSPDDVLSLIVFLVGFAALSLFGAKNFVNKDKI